LLSWFLRRGRATPPYPRQRRALPWRRPPRTDYGAAIDGVLRAFEPRIRAVARERALAPALATELRRHPPARRFLLVRNSLRFRNLALCGLLLRSVREEGRRPDSPVSPAAPPSPPSDAEEWARLALFALDLLDTGVYGASVVEDFRGRAWGRIAEARRLAGDRDGARAALATALHRLRRGTGDLLERAQVLDQMAALRREEGRWADALRLLARSASAYRRLGEWQLEARCLLEAAGVWRERGEAGRALAVLREAERRIDPGLDPGLAARLRRHLAECLTAAGRPLEAQAVLAAARARRRASPRQRSRALAGRLRLVGR
jgi:tetratricopeptide (TPR) repeat protein